MIRAKLTVTEIAETQYGAGNHSIRVKLTPQYDTSIPEDVRFSQYTPSGEFWMQVTNPAVLEQMKLGQSFYLDMTAIEPPTV